MMAERTRKREMIRLSEDIMEITAAAIYCAERLETIRQQSLTFQARLRRLEGWQVIEGGRVDDSEPLRAA